MLFTPAFRMMDLASAPRSAADGTNTLSHTLHVPFPLLTAATVPLQAASVGNAVRVSEMESATNEKVSLSYRWCCSRPPRSSCRAQYHLPRLR